MFLSKRSNGIYYIFDNMPNGKRIRISTRSRTKKEAMKRFAELAKELKDKKEEKEETVIPIRLQPFSLQYLKYSKSFHTDKTTLTYKTTFNAMKEYFGDILLTDITEQQIEEFLQHRITTSSLYSARKDLINIKASSNWAVRKSYLLKNPAVNLKRIKVPEKLPAYFSKEEFKKFLKHIDRVDFKDLVIFAVHTGLRQAELISLQKSQIDLRSRYLLLDNRNHITKSKKIRRVPLNSTALEIAKKRMNDICPSEYLFTIRGVPIKGDYVVRTFAKLIKRAELNKDLHFHSLRHTFASWLVQRGASIYDVSKLLGHSEIKTTEIYAHLRIEDFRNAVTLLE